MSRSVHFVFAPQYRQLGSTVMRSSQLSVIARRALRGRRVRFSPLGRRVRGADLFLSKGALQVITEAQLSHYRDRGNRLFFDPVDDEPSPYTADFADVLVAASTEAFRDFSARYPAKRVVLVNHSVDLRIPSIPGLGAAEGFRIGYFGEMANTVSGPGLSALVDFIPVDTAHQDDSWLAALPRYSMHYAIRRRQPMDAHKPFTKGFTAAFCRAPILIQEGDAEAVHWLGSDYPFFHGGPLTESAIIDSVEAVRDSFGSERWRHALEVMAGIRDRVAPERIGEELRQALA